jgi:hypothetical protein
LSILLTQAKRIFWSSRLPWPSLFYHVRDLFRRAHNFGDELASMPSAAHHGGEEGEADPPTPHSRVWVGTRPVRSVRSGPVPGRGTVPGASAPGRVGGGSASSANKQSSAATSLDWVAGLGTRCVVVPVGEVTPGGASRDPGIDLSGLSPHSGGGGHGRSGVLLRLQGE